MKQYLQRCANVIELCVENEKQETGINIFQQQLKDSIEIDYKYNETSCLNNLKWIKDSKLAKEFQTFADTLPWQKISNNINSGYVDISKDILQNVSISTNLLLICEGEELNKKLDKNTLFFIISGTADWVIGDNVYTSFSAGNVLNSNENSNIKAKAGHTPLLLLSISWND